MSTTPSPLSPSLPLSSLYAAPQEAKTEEKRDYHGSWMSQLKAYSSLLSPFLSTVGETQVFVRVSSINTQPGTSEPTLSTSSTSFVSRSQLLQAALDTRLLFPVMHASFRAPIGHGRKPRPCPPARPKLPVRPTQQLSLNSQFGQLSSSASSLRPPSPAPELDSGPSAMEDPRLLAPELDGGPSAMDNPRSPSPRPPASSQMPPDSLGRAATFSLSIPN